MFISRETLKNLQRRLKTLEEEHFSEAGKLRGRIADVELGVEALKVRQSQLEVDVRSLGPNPWTKITEITSEQFDSQQQLVANRHQIEALQDAQRANLESVGLTFGEADNNFDEIQQLLEDQEETLALLAEAVLEIVDSLDERTLAHGKSRSKTRK